MCYVFLACLCLPCFFLYISLCTCLCLFADFTRGRARSVRSFGKPGGKQMTTDQSRTKTMVPLHKAGCIRTLPRGSKWLTRKMTTDQSRTNETMVPLCQKRERRRRGQTDNIPSSSATHHRHPTGLLQASPTKGRLAREERPAAQATQGGAVSGRLWGISAVKRHASRCTRFAASTHPRRMWLPKGSVSPLCSPSARPSPATPRHGSSTGCGQRCRASIQVHSDARLRRVAHVDWQVLQQL